MGRVARAGLFEEVTYLGLRVPVWRGITHRMGLDWELLKAPVTFEEGRNLALSPLYWRGKKKLLFCLPSTGGAITLSQGGDFVSLLRGPARVF